MAFDVNAFINSMIQDDKDQQYLAYDKFLHARLTDSEKNLFFKKVQDLYIEVKEDAAYYSSVLFLKGLLEASGIGCKANIPCALKLLRESTALENTFAMQELAVIYNHGMDGITYHNQAITQLNGAIKLNNPFAMNTRALMYEKGWGGAGVVDLNAAIHLYEKAAALNNSQALRRLGDIYRRGNAVVPVDIKKAIDYYKQSIALDDPLSMGRLGDIYLQHSEYGTVEEAYTLVKRAADLGYTNAMVSLGRMLMEGKGCKANLDEAIFIFDAAIELKHPSAMYHRGELYEKAREYEQAIKLYKQAINLGNTKAMIAMAGLYSDGKGTTPQPLEAMKLYKQAFTLGNKENIPLCAQAFFHIETLDYTTAIQLYDQAIAQQNSAAMYRRAWMHLNSMGGPKDLAAAIVLLDKAIELNSEEAIMARAKLHEDNKELTEAAKLYDKALALGYLPAAAKRAEIYNKASVNPIHLIKCRVLRLLANSSPKAEPLSNEDQGFFNVLCHNKATNLSKSSIYPLGVALHFLKSLPPNLAGVSALKDRIDQAVGLKIIPAFTVLEDFQGKISHLGGRRIDALMFLIDNYAERHYDLEGRKKVWQTFSYQAMAESKDPNALRNLKELADVFPKLNYWVGMSYLNADTPAGFFSKSGKQEAVKWFQKATSEKNHDEVIKQAAYAQLAKLGVSIPVKDQAVKVIIPVASAPNIDLESKKEPDLQQYIAPEEPSVKSTQKKETSLALAEPSEIAMIPVASASVSNVSIFSLLQLPSVPEIAPVEENYTSRSSSSNNSPRVALTS